ncbi:MAG: alkaline phosphatase family protein [bacterium]
MSEPLVVIDLVGAVPKHFDRPPLFPELARIFRAGGVRPIVPVCPAVTCPVQVSLVTGVPPAQHGIVANGLFDRAEHSVTLWTWPAERIERPPIWEQLRKRNPRARTAVLFFQGLKANTADIFINPHPKHTDDGRTLPWCDSRPEGLYEGLVDQLGHFPLDRYWGPMAGIESSRWILDAGLRTLAKFRPDLSLVYVPHLDYVGQRHGPESDEFRQEARRIDAAVAEFIDGLARAFRPASPRVVLLSEYAFAPVARAGLPNVALREAGLLRVNEDDGTQRLDLANSRAFAMVDHQVAHVYADADAVDAAADALAGLETVAEACRGERLRELGLAHENAGELLLLAEDDAWFAYYWWTDPAAAPEFARTVDIHRKPGYDPVELFVDPATRSIPLDASLVRGSHGLPADRPDRHAVLLSDAPLGLPAGPLGIAELTGPLLRAALQSRT